MPNAPHTDPAARRPRAQSYRPNNVYPSNYVNHTRASRYSRYERSRSRDRSPDRYERASQFGDGDRRRSSAEVRSNNAAFQSNRESFADPLRRDPPRGPKALIDPPSGPRGGGFVGDLRGGRGRGRGRGWSSRDESRDRGRDRDIDFRDRYRDDRSREHDRERDRDRDWRDSRDFRSRRSPIGRPRSPVREYRDRERDGPIGVDADRPRRGSRDGGPPSAGSTSSDPFGMSPFPRGGFHRGRGRGRGDWGSDRGRGRMPFMDDRNDRYPRSRSQEGRWGRDRDERDRMDRPDRYNDMDARHMPRDGPRDDRDPRERELFRSKLEARTVTSQDGPSSKEVSPPPVAPSAPAFGTVPNRTLSVGEGYAPVSAVAKAPPTAPRAFVERPPSAGHSVGHEPSIPPIGPAKPAIHDSPPIPVGPRAQQQKQQRPSSMQWVNPNLKKVPDSPKMMRSQSFAQQRPPPLRRDSTQHDYPYDDRRRPGSSDAKSDSHMSSSDNRARSHYSAEPGEITVRSERDSVSTRTSMDRDMRMSRDNYRGSSGPSPTIDNAPRFPRASIERNDFVRAPPKEMVKPKARRVRFSVERLEIPPKKAAVEQNSESDDDEDMGDFFSMEIAKMEGELDKLEKPKLPTEVVARFAALSHGAMVKVVNEGEGLTDMIGSLPQTDEPLDMEVEEPTPTGTKPDDNIETADAIDVRGDEMEIDGEKENGEQEETRKEVEKTLEGEIAVPAQQDEPTTEVSEAEPEPKVEKMELDEAPTDIPPIPTAPEEASTAPDAPVAPVAPEPQESTTAETAVEESSIKPTDASTDAPTDAPLAKPEEPSETAPLGEALIIDGPPKLALDTRDTGAKSPSTPSQVADDDETESEEDFYMSIDSVRKYMATPPLDSLPDYSCESWDKDQDFLQTLDSDPIIDDFVIDHINKLHLEKTVEQTREQKVYADNYAHYLEFTLSSDPVAVKSRGKFTASTASIDGTGSVTPEHKHEGSGRGRRFATERDLERVLQASMREDEERKERELRMQQEKYRSEKEAIIPDMIWTQEEKDDIHWIDQSGFTSQDKLVSAWRVLPPVNNFTEEESELFEKRYMEAPKQWGRVADAVPHRDFGSCIQYYYMKKKELNLKEKLKKQPKRRKKGGRGKQRSSALVSELGNGEPETEDNHETGENGERRRPRRAAAPTWNFEQPPVDTDNSTPTGTPGRRGGSAKVDQPEKVDGRKGRRKKDKEPKIPKGNQTLAAAPAPGAGRGRSRSNSRAQNVEFQPALPSEVHRLPTQFEQPPAGIQPPYTVQQQQPIQSLERPPAIAASAITEVMAAPSLRPEPPPPPPAMSTFGLAQAQPERKAPTQASSYWSVSESNDFPALLRAFGSDWTAIAAHMGSKTAVMVKNYFVRQKDQGKTEWETIVQEADLKRSRGEPRPDPPQPSTGGRGRRYDTSSTSSSRPIAVAPGIDLRNETPQPKLETVGQGPRGQPFSSYGVPIAQAPVQQPLAQPPQQGMVMQQHAGSQPVSQAMSPVPRPLRAPMPPFSFPEREREREREPGQRVPLPQKAPPSQPGMDPRDQRPLAAAQPLQPAQPDAMAERNAQLELQKMEMQLREQQQQQQQHLQQREREREMARQAERQPLRVKQEPDVAPQQHHYEPFGHRSQGSHGQPLGRPLPDLSRPPSYPPSVQSQPPSQPARSILSEQPPVRSPQMAALNNRPISQLQSRPSSGSLSDPYGSSTPQTSTPTPAAAPPRPPEPKKGGLNIMSLLNNDDAPPTPKRVSDVASTPIRPSPTPPPQSLGRSLAGPPPSQMRREPEPQYPPYGRTASGGASAMPSLKPSYPDSPQIQHMGSSRASMGLPGDAERDYYRQHPYQPTQPTGTDSPQSSHRYPPPGQPGQVQYQSQGGYSTSYAASNQPPHASSPSAQYALHPSASRAREVSQGGRETSWPPASHQSQSSLSQSSGWPSQPPPNTSQPPPTQQQGWPTHPSTKPATPAPSWSSAPPPPQQHHMSMRDDPRSSAYYGSSSSSLSQQQQQQQHQMQGRYQTPVSRGPEQVPPPSQAYRGYASTPGPVQPRDPREIPSRSYTPVGYDARGPPQPPGPGYPAPGPDPREMQMRDNRDPRDPRDPRDMMARSLRPHEYDRHPDQYRR